MSAFTYAEAPVPVPERIAEAHRGAWRRVARPGCWWTGSQRVEIAHECRRTFECALCRERKAALSVAAVAGEHEATGLLPAAAVDAVHRITTDASRLSKTWVEKLAAAGVSDGHYVELLGVVVAVLSIDEFHRGLGLPLEPLPEPAEGQPSRRRPEGLRSGVAWVPMLPARAALGENSDLYDGLPNAPNVIAAMSLVPDAVRELKSLSGAHYLRAIDVLDPDVDGDALSRMQIELIAARVSALNECFY